MSPALGALLDAVALAALMGLAASIGVAALVRLGEDALRRVPPARRADALLLGGALPTLLAAATLLGALFPSLLDLLGVTPDHCGEHGHHAHLCLVHPAANGAELAWLGLGVLGVLGVRATSRIARAVRAARVLAALERLGRDDAPVGYPLRLVPGAPRLCLAVGVLWRRIVLSGELPALLGAPATRAALAHERAHLARHDPLARSLLAVAALAALPRTLDRLTALHVEATEEACDEEAAVEVGSARSVAEALVRAARLRIAPALDASAGLAGASLERRVVRLLSLTTPRRSASLGLGGLLALTSAALLATAALAEPLHHALETLLHLVA